MGIQAQENPRVRMVVEINKPRGHHLACGVNHPGSLPREVLPYGGDLSIFYRDVPFAAGRPRSVH